MVVFSPDNHPQGLAALSGAIPIVVSQLPVPPSSVPPVKTHSDKVSHGAVRGRTHAGGLTLFGAPHISPS